jgi:hypothetical protein
MDKGTVTDEDIRKLLFDAQRCRNNLVADRCSKALAGDPESRAQVEKIILDARNDLG